MISDADRGLLEAVRNVTNPILLLEGTLKGETVTFICVAYNERGEGVYGLEDVAGQTNIYPVGVLHALTDEEHGHCLDPDGEALEPLQRPDGPCEGCGEAPCPYDQERP